VIAQARTANEDGMEESAIRPNRSRFRVFTRARGDIRSLLVLAVTAMVLHGWIIAHAAVPARDSLVFIRYAWRLQEEPWRMVLGDSPQPPLYPLTIAAASLPLRYFTSSATSLGMQYSAQVAAALAGTLLVVPMYYVGRMLFQRRVAFWSSLLFQCLPVSAHVLSDGLSEGLFLSLVATFFAIAGVALRRRSLPALGLAGLSSGLAYLTRPEGAALAVVLLLILACCQWRHSWGWRRFVSGTAVLVGGALAPALPYMCIIHGFSNKTTAGAILSPCAGSFGSPQSWFDRVSDEVRLAAAIAPASDVVGDAPPSFLLDSSRNTDAPRRSLGGAVHAVVAETGKSFHYVAWLPAALGLWWFRSRLRTRPIAAVMALAALAHIAVLVRVAFVAGYVSERHTLLVVLCLTPWVVAGILEVPRRIGIIGTAMGFSPTVTSWGGRERTVAWCLLVVLTAYGLPSTLRVLHASKQGFRDSGLWLATRADPADVIVDPFGWSEFYAGRTLSGPIPRPTTPGHTPCYYVVLDNLSPSPRHSELPLMPEARRLAEQGVLVYHWPTSRPISEAVVRIFAVPASAGGKRSDDATGASLDPNL
jgi:4-amino-4-deoxy-L-arabinose transferase-like glycosyltransferase